MKILLHLSILFPLFFMTCSASGYTLSDAVNSLKKFDANQIVVNKTRTQKQVGEKVQEMLSKINDGVELIKVEKTNVPPELFHEIIRVAAITMTVDPSEAAIEIILPIYQKDKKAFEKALEQLPKKDRESFKNSIKNAARESSEGNG
jgi:hypothetical protein